MQRHTPKIALILLILLLIICVTAYALAYNSLQAANAGYGLPIALLLLLSIAIGFTLYIFITQEANHIDKLNNKIEQLHAMLEQAQSSLHKDKSEEKREAQTIEENINQIVDDLLPKSGDTIEQQAEQLLTNIAHKFSIAQGTFHLLNADSNLFELCASYANFTESQPLSYKLGETLPGQVAKNKHPLGLDKLPSGYIAVMSGLGKSSPSGLIIAPVIDPNDNAIGVLEISLFKAIPQHIIEPMFEQLGKRFGQLITAAPRNTTQA